MRKLLVLLVCFGFIICLKRVTLSGEYINEPGNIIEAEKMAVGMKSKAYYVILKGIKGYKIFPIESVYDYWPETENVSQH